METEIWKDIPNYEGLYQVSDLGNVKRLKRKIILKSDFELILKEKILKQSYNKGYKKVHLSYNNSRKYYSVHQLVAMAFLNHKPCGLNIVVDHINENKDDNTIKNIQLVTQRHNISKSIKNKSSKHTGVSWDKKNKKWRKNL